MPYYLMISKDRGVTYEKEDPAVAHPSDLTKRMDELDAAGLRWYIVGPDEEPLYGYRICLEHKRILEREYIFPKINDNGTIGEKRSSND